MAFFKAVLCFLSYWKWFTTNKDFYEYETAIELFSSTNTCEMISILKCFLWRYVSKKKFKQSSLNCIFTNLHFNSKEERESTFKTFLGLMYKCYLLHWQRASAVSNFISFIIDERRNEGHIISDVLLAFFLPLHLSKNDLKNLLHSFTPYDAYQKALKKKLKCSGVH